MEKNNSANSWFYFKPLVGGRITSKARKHKLFNEVRLVIGDFELPLQFKKIEATNLVKRTISQTCMYHSLLLAFSDVTYFLIGLGKNINLSFFINMGPELFWGNQGPYSKNILSQMCM